MPGREVDRVQAAHRVTDAARAVDAEAIEDGEGVGREVSGRVAVGGAPALAVPSGIRRDEAQASRERVGEEIPVAPVVTDPVQEQRWRRGARPRPVDELRSFAYEGAARGHHPKYSSTVIAALRMLVERRELLVDFAWRELRARYKGSALGFMWYFVNPLLQLVVFWILFGVV